MQPTDLTVSAVIERDGKFLVVEERVSGNLVINLPGGHLEPGETPEQAIVRETLEETGSSISVCGLLGVYLWIHPQTRQQFLRLVYVADFVSCDESLPLDHSIVSRQWLTRADIEARRNSLRSPAVLRCVHDYEAGRRESDTLIAGMFPLQNHVDRVLARADLV